MEKLLYIIVETERELAEQYRRQKKEVEAWVEAEKRKIDQDIELKKTDLEEEAKALYKIIIEDATLDARELIERSTKLADSLDDLEEGFLKNIVISYLNDLCSFEEK